MNYGDGIGEAGYYPARGPSGTPGSGRAKHSCGVEHLNVRLTSERLASFSHRINSPVRGRSGSFRSRCQRARARGRVDCHIAAQHAGAPANRQSATRHTSELPLGSMPTAPLLDGAPASGAVRHFIDCAASACRRLSNAARICSVLVRLAGTAAMATGAGEGSLLWSRL